ncbi:glycosyltransferase [Achromobacter xylosoxidans]
MQKIPVSVVVMTKNEERNIAKCLKALAEFDEVFVIDSRSTDATCALAASLGAKVVDFQWNGKYPKKKQWCLEQLPFSHPVVLYVDADEEMTPALAREIRASLPRFEAGAGGAFVPFDYVFCGASCDTATASTSWRCWPATARASWTTTTWTWPTCGKSRATTSPRYRARPSRCASPWSTMTMTRCSTISTSTTATRTGRQACASRA